MTLFLEEYEYVPKLTQAAGARIVIHDQSVMPFPGESAISVTANTMVNIGVKKVTSKFIIHQTYYLEGRD